MSNRPSYGVRQVRQGLSKAIFMDNWRQSFYKPNAPPVARRSLDRKGG